MRIVVQSAIIVLLGIVISYGQILGTACEPYGSISIKGEPAADNIPVVAYIDNQEMASCLTVGGQYSLVIAKDDPDTPEKDGWIEGDIIVIMVNGTMANPSFTASAGRMRIDLTLNSLSVRLDTWGKIKALFR
jgi:hypothetical protein